MFSRDDLQQLAEYQGQHAVLSLTLNVDPTRRTKDEYRLALRHLLHSIQGRANGDIALIERFFESEYDWSGRGLAIFSSQKENFWKVYSLAVPIVDSVSIGLKPHLTPLANLWDVYGRFVVAVVDKQGARFIFVQLGEVVDGEGVLGEEVRRVKSGAGSTKTGRRRNSDEPTDRHVQEVIKRNVKDTAHALQQFCEKHTPRYVVLGGNAEIINDVRAHLGQPWAERVIGTIAGDVSDADLVLRDRALKAVEEAELKREFGLADAAITAAAKNSHGAVQIDRVLTAAHAGQIQTLLVAEGFTSEGHRCRQCGYVTMAPGAQCQFCGGAFEQIPDAVEAAISKVLEQGGRVDIVHGHAELNEVGVAALLRY
jgi:Bacterial archaeo-eukaryotic release factor family 10